MSKQFVVGNLSTFVDKEAAAREAADADIRKMSLLYAACSTAAGTCAKAVAIDGFGDPVENMVLKVMFQNGHTALSTKSSDRTVSADYPTLSVNGGTAYPITVAGEYAGENFVRAGEVHELMFTGSAWEDFTATNIYSGSDSNGDYVKKRDGKIEYPTNSGVLVIHNQTEFDDWVEGTKTAPAVKIMAGEYTTNNSIYPENLGCDSIEGIGDVIITFNNANSIIYNTMPNDDVFHYIRNIHAIVNAPIHCHGFFKCVNLENCSIVGDAPNNAVGFFSCKNLRHCIADATGTSIVNAFRTCKNLMDCKGRGHAAFSSCTGVLHCGASGHCKGRVFDDSYASQSENAEYACADTPEGGFNDASNPDEETTEE